jgi:hypothetical protein
VRHSIDENLIQMDKGIYNNTNQWSDPNVAHNGGERGSNINGVLRHRNGS